MPLCINHTAYHTVPLERQVKLRDSAIRRLAGLLLLAFIVGCDDSSGPVPVGSVEISPPDPSVEVGSTIQLEAAVLDASGDELTDRSVEWSSDDPQIAEVDSGGLVTGIAEGNTMIRAESGGVEGTVQLAVTVSAFTCTPEGDPLNLPVGEQLLLQSPSTFCLRFEETSGEEIYLIGLQSTSAVPALVIPATITSTTGGEDGGGAIASTFQSPDQPAQLGADALSRSPQAQRLHSHRSAEMRLRELERRVLGPAGRAAGTASSASSPAGAANTAGAMRIPSSVEVGDQVAVRVPNIGGGSDELCEFNAIETVVREVGRRGVWLHDLENPTDGYTDQDYQEMSALLDDIIFETNVAYFGQPEDLDGNDRIVIVTTKEVNKVEGLLGFVTNADFADRSQCASSDEGELYYGRAPDPDGEFGAEYTRATARLDSPLLIAHEFTHIIQFGRRLARAGFPPLPTRWELEGQATLAEEVVGHEVTGRSTGQNYGAPVAWNEAPETSVQSWYTNAFIDMAFYFGFQGNDRAQVQNAPEQCTWIDAQGSDNYGPCEGRPFVYGVSWSFLRWLSDQYGPEFGGGEQELHRSMVENDTTGYETVESVVGVPIETLLAQWAAALYVDDRVPAADDALTMTSWDLAEIFGSRQEAARLQPYQRSFSDFSDDVSVRAGSTAYFLVGGADRPATAIRATDRSDQSLPGEMQLWVVRLQ